MMRVVSWLTTQIIVAFGVFVASAMFAGVAGFLQLLPTLAPFVVRGIWTVLALSCRLDYVLLSAAAPWFEKYGRVRILDGPYRLASTVMFSFVMGFVGIWLLQWSLNGWLLLGFMFHGLFVSLIWNEISPEGQILMGTKLPWHR